MQYYFRNLVSSLGLLVLFFTGSGTADTADKSAFVNDQGRVTLISGSPFTEKPQKRFVGLHFKMKPGWKIYWRSPGDAGFPPQINWDDSQNASRFEMFWPIPKRFSVLGLSTLGYEGEVVFPVSVEVLNTDRPVVIRANLSYLTCNKVCIPHRTNLHLHLNKQEGFNTADARLIERYLKRVPSQGHKKELSVVRIEVGNTSRDPELRIAVRAVGGFNNRDLFVEGPDGYVFEQMEWQKQKVANEGLFTAKYRDLIKTSQKNRTLIGEKIRLTLINGETAIEQTAVVKAAAKHYRSEKLDFVSFSEMTWIFGLGILGGLILNLMPCVLPVLSLKAMSLVQNGSSELRAIRGNFLVTAAGIIFSFFVLATMVVCFKFTGQQVGWGMQFQQPLFLSFVAIVVLMFGANLWGLFNVNLPSGISTLVAQHSQGGLLDKHFWTGVFATLLATPCSAPFLGTAVGFALGGNILQIYAIFFAIGLGFSLPYLTFATVPACSKFLPRPGVWMVWMKRVLALLLFGTALWLVSIIGDQTGGLTMIAVFLGLLFIITGLSLFRILARAGASLLVLGVLSTMFAPVLLQDGNHKNEINSSIDWKELDKDQISGFVKLGKVVFVDITAEWCVTCKANKFLTLENKEVARQLNSAEVIAMQGDWTKADPSISAFLRKFNRYGIPFNVVFGPAAPKGIVLSEILVKTGVLKALRAARLR